MDDRLALHLELAALTDEEFVERAYALAEARYQTTQLVGNGAAVNHLRARADELQEKKMQIAEQFEEAIEALQRTRGSKEELTFWIGITPEGADPRIAGGLATLTASYATGGVIMNESVTIASGCEVILTSNAPTGDGL